MICEPSDSRELYYHEPSGQQIRVDERKDGQVFYVRWCPGDELGRPERRSEEQFDELIEEEGARKVTPEEWPVTSG